eukprot:PhM_4_TR18848/c0_g1_i1/m.70532
MMPFPIDVFLDEEKENDAKDQTTSNTNMNMSTNTSSNPAMSVSVNSDRRLSFSTRSVGGGGSIMISPVALGAPDMVHALEEEARKQELGKGVALKQQEHPIAPPLSLDIIPYHSLPPINMGRALPRKFKVFVGGLRYDMEHRMVTRVVSYLTGMALPHDNVLTFARGQHHAQLSSDGKPLTSGSAILHLPTQQAMDRIISYHKRVLCEEEGLRIAPDVAAMGQYLNHRCGGPHPLVIEPALPKKTTGSPQNHAMKQQEQQSQQQQQQQQ